MQVREVQNPQRSPAARLPQGDAAARDVQPPRLDIARVQQGRAEERKQKLTAGHTEETLDLIIAWIGPGRGTKMRRGPVKGPRRSNSSGYHNSFKPNCTCRGEFAWPPVL